MQWCDKVKANTQSSKHSIGQKTGNDAKYSCHACHAKPEPELQSLRAHEQQTVECKKKLNPDCAETGSFEVPVKKHGHTNINHRPITSASQSKELHHKPIIQQEKEKRRACM